MGNSSSHRRTKAPKLPCKERPPDMDKAQGQQFFSHFQQKKPNAKIVLLFSLDKRQQRTEGAAGPGVRAQRPKEDATSVRACLPASPMLRGAGDGPDRRERARRCELKVQVLLLQVDARLHEEGRRAEGGATAGGGATAQRAGPKAKQSRQRLFSSPGQQSEADAERNHGKQRRRCSRSRP
ncbi:uncharacterized protein C20orf144 homolog [Erethizon dorsatum]